MYQVQLGQKEQNIIISINNTRRGGGFNCKAHELNQGALEIERPFLGTLRYVDAAVFGSNSMKPATRHEISFEFWKGI